MSTARLATLTDLRPHQQWVARRNETRGGKTTKVPYFSANRKAEADNPGTWITYDQAKIVLASIVNGSGGGVGLELGKCEENWIIGIDLDTCRNPETGSIEPWAIEVIDRFASTSEVSPSDKGVKVFASVDPAVIPELRRIMGTETGRQFKKTSGGDHPPAIELYISDRYFAVTWKTLDNAPAELRTVPLSDLRWLIEEAGPRFVGKTPDKPSTDKSRSAIAFRKGAALRRQGKSFTGMVAALHADPETSVWTKEKGEPNGQRELKRIWDKIDPEKERPESTLVTEDTVATCFAIAHAGELLFDHDAGAWYRWTGVVWRREKTKLAYSYARDLARILSAKSANFKAQLSAGRAAFAAGVERFAQSDRSFAITSEVWDRDKFLLGTPDGTVDLTTGKLREANQSDHITKQAAVRPSEVASCPLWLGFLNQATRDDHDAVAYLKRWFGYSLTGDTREHKLVFAWGPGGNGKGVMMNTASAIFNDYCAIAAMDSFVVTRDDKHSTDLAMLAGARLVMTTEVDEGQILAQAKVNQLTGGDPITARFMHRDNFTYIPQFKLMISGNNEVDPENWTGC